MERAGPSLRIDIPTVVSGVRTTPSAIAAIDPADLRPHSGRTGHESVMTVKEIEGGWRLSRPLLVPNKVIYQKSLLERRITAIVEQRCDKYKSY
jgi:hypothetical protein